jgi:hypothetical protein
MVHAMLFALVLAAPAAAGPAWEAPVLIASGAGEKGRWRQNDSRYDYADDASVAFAHDGSLALAWVDQKSRDVWLRRLAPGGRLGAPVNVSRSPATFSWLPRMAADPARPGRLCLLWQEIIFSGGSHGGDILFACANDGVKVFSPSLNLSRSIGGDGKGRLDRHTWSNGSLDLAIGANGTIFAAWTEYHGALWLSRSLDGGTSFSRPRRIAGDDARPARAPSLAVGPGRTVYLAWTVGEDPQASIRVARSLDDGASFGAPLLVGGGEGAADAPRLAVGEGGSLHLVYAQGGAVRYTRAAPGAGFGPVRTLSNPGAGYPVLAGDGGNALVVAWEEMGKSGRPQALGIAVSRDKGRSFSAPATVPGSAAPTGGSNGSQQGLLGAKLAVSRDGRIALVNSSLVPGKRSQVWLMRAR